MEKNSCIVFEVLKKYGKIKNFYFNVDFSFGVLFYYYGFYEMLYYIVIFGVSRGLGLLV